MTPPRILGAMTAAWLLSVSLAQAAGPEAEKGAPALRAAPIRGGFVISGARDPGQWMFEMGPTGHPRQALMLSTVGDGGGMAFKCTRDKGEEELAIAIPGAEAEKVGADMDLTLAVGVRANTLHAKVSSMEPGKPPLFMASGAAIPDILNTMAGHPLWAEQGVVRVEDGHGHSITFQLPNPRSMAAMAATVCAGWHKQADMRDAPASGMHPGLQLPQAATSGPDSALESLIDKHGRK